VTVSLDLHVAGRDQRVTVRPTRLIVAGYTAKDEAAARAHIAELAAIGIPPPATVPAFYDLDPALLTTEAVIEVSGPATSGEVEPVLVRRGGQYYLAVGSDHTDRELERADIASAKAACPKPIGETVVELGELSTVRWDGLAASSTVDGRPYQDGDLGLLRSASELIERMGAVLGQISDDLVMFCGTLPLLDGEFVPGARWQLQLRTPEGATLSHEYHAKSRSA
jgi:uncharacterized protein DUF2848